MGELEDLAERAGHAEVLEKGRELLASPATVGGAIHLARLLSRRRRHPEAVALAHDIFRALRRSRDLNVLMSTVIASGDMKELRRVLTLASSYVTTDAYTYNVQLIATWLRALRQVDDQGQFWQVYDSMCAAADKHSNPFVIAEYYQMLIRTGRYAEVVRHFETLDSSLRSDDLLRKLAARAHIELGQIEVGEALFRDTRKDHMWRALEGRLAEVRERQGVVASDEAAGTLAEAAATPLPPVKRNRVFVVHGHDIGALAQVENLLHRIGAEPWTFDRLPKAGSPTVIELLERFIPAADAVVVLLTPDDEGRKARTDEPLEPRARQNVLVEGGYAVISKRSLSLIIALGGVAIPSDFAGIHRIQRDVWNEGAAVELANRLKDMGLSVDPAKAFSVNV